MNIKKHLINFTIVGGSLLFCFLALEILLRFFPVSTGISISPVNVKNSVFHATPNKKIRYSMSWNFKNVRIKNINNAGFVNPQDYVVSDANTLLAVVGDSYVEAMQVQDHEAYPNLLREHAPNMRIYSFGFSGAPLSQYLIWAQHAKQNFHNDYLIINVVGNDFDESLLKYYSFVPGFHLYAPDANDELQLQRTDWQPSLTREFAKKSYLLSYLIRNLEVTVAKDRINAMLSKQTPPADVTRINDSYQAIDAFFRDLPQYTGLDAKHIMFVLDDRTATYQSTPDPALELPYFHLMKRYFNARAQQLGYAVIDMSVPFHQHFQQYGERFEFSYDYHWNSLGHTVVADAIMQSKWWRELRI